MDNGSIVYGFFIIPMELMIIVGSIIALFGLAFLARGPEASLLIEPQRI